MAPPKSRARRTPLEGLNQPITEAEVRERLARLERRKATGADRTASAELKEATEQLAPVLTQLFNDVLRTGHYPASWRHGIVVPLFKGKGSRSEAGNYRPIRLLSNVGKLLEGVLAVRLREALEAAGREIGEIDCVVLATLSADHNRMKVVSCDQLDADGNTK